MIHTVEDYVDDISLELGFPFVDVETKKLLPKIVELSFKELKKYITIPQYETVSFSSGRIDMSKYHVLNVHYVMRAEPENGIYNLFADAYLSGNIRYPATSLDSSDYRILIELNQLKNTISTDLDWVWDDPYLYLATNVPHPSQVTVVFTPDYDNVVELKDPFWQDYLRRLSVAHAKVQLGRVRGKYDLNGSQYSLDGAQLLSEGNAELQSIREELDQSMDLLIPLD